MTDATRKTRFRFWLWLIRVIDVIVPRRLRVDWRQEWEEFAALMQTQHVFDTLYGLVGA